MRRALPAIVLSAAGLTVLLQAQREIDARVAGPAAVGDNPFAAPDGLAVPLGGRTVSGKSVATPFGPVQVAVVMSGDRLADVQALHYPQDDPKSRIINSAAIPKLHDEALVAQSARIDGVSGATETSDGYRQSLQSGLDNAARPPGSGAPPGDGVASTTTSSSPTTTATTKAKGTSRRGGGGTRTATGPVVTEKFGPVQVQVTVTGGRVTLVKAIQIPAGNSNPETVEMTKGINADAIPKLEKAALDAQSADIATVTGATLTSDAFKKSLQAALDQALSA